MNCSRSGECSGFSFGASWMGFDTYPRDRRHDLISFTLALAFTSYCVGGATAAGAAVQFRCRPNDLQSDCAGPWRPVPKDSILTGYRLVACCSHCNRSRLNSATLVFGRDQPVAQPARPTSSVAWAHVNKRFIETFSLPAYVRADAHFPGTACRLVAGDAQRLHHRCMRAVRYIL